MRSSLSLRIFEHAENLTSSSATVAGNVVDVKDQLNSYTMATQQQFSMLDMRIQTMQQMFEQAMLRSIPTSGYGMSRTERSTESINQLELRNKRQESNSRSTQELACWPVRVVSPAILIRQRNGNLYSELLPDECQSFGPLSASRRTEFARALQSLRLLIWFLSKQNHYITLNSMK